MDAGEFLNDSLIDFYLKWLRDHQSRPALRDQCHFFSSHFYTKLEGAGFGGDRPDHAAVRRWTRGVNLFAKRLVFVPVNQAAHWSLAVVCSPGHLAISPEEFGEPCVLHLDSLRLHSGKEVARRLRGYLALEYEKQYPGGGPVAFTASTMPLVRPPVPSQGNTSDCGVYVLEYAKRILTEPAFTKPTSIQVESRFQDFLNRKMFGESLIREKRQAIRKLILQLHDEQQQQQQHEPKSESGQTNGKTTMTL
uniref:Ubiquitin-like protease family profile domain-containing protein n=1 Tax=Heterosigma akashiwo TaxID=2829 RepID=A0A7S3XZ20_HETAK